MGRLNVDGMKPVYILNDNIISSLGFTTAANVAAIEKGTIKAVKEDSCQGQALSLTGT